MLDFVFYSNFLRKFTLPVSQFQSLATIIPEPKNIQSNPVNIAQFFQFVDYLENKKATSSSAFKQYFSLGFLKTIKGQLSTDSKVQLFNFIKNFLGSIQAYHPQIWNLDILSLRVLNMLYTSSIIFEKNDYSELKKSYFKTVLAQSIYLRKRLKSHISHRDYILYVIRACYASICFLEERPHLKSMMMLLENLLTVQFNQDGGHVTRNPSFQLKIMEELDCLKCLAVSAGVSLPKNFQTITSLSADYINFMRHPDGKFSIFNGGYEGDSQYIDEILGVKFSDLKTNKNNRLKHTGYYRIASHKLSLIADIPPSNGEKNEFYQGNLSFELSIDKQRVFVNCGCGDELGGEWVQALKKSDAHTMPVIKIPYLKPSDKTPLITGKKLSDNIIITNNQGYTIEAAQSYEFGRSGHFTHHRQITLFKNGSVLKGEDSFCLSANDSKEPVSNPECWLRFHLAPSVKATSSGSSVIISLPDNGEWMFTVGSGKTVLEPSVYVGSGIPQETHQILVKLSLNKSLVKFRWTLQEVTKLEKNNEKRESNILDVENIKNTELFEKDLQNIDETV